MLETDEKSIATQAINEQSSIISANQGRERYVSIMEHANQISSSPYRAGLVEGMLDLMLDVTLAESANFFHYSPETEELVFSTVRGDKDSNHLIGLRLTPKQVLPEVSINGAQPVVIGDLPSYSHWLRTADPTNAASKYNMICLPIRFQEHILGVVQLFNYTHAELDILSALSNRFAIDLNHWDQADKSYLSNQRMTKLLNILGDIAGTLDRNRLLHLVTENASHLVDAERCSLFLVDPETNEMIFQVAYQSKENDLPKSASRAEKYSGKYKSLSGNSRPFMGHSNTSDRDFKYYNRSAITMPLSSAPHAQDQVLHRNHVLGGLMALTKQNAYFDEEDARLMQILASQTSTFLQVAEMYESAGDLFLGVIKALVAAIDAKDPYTQGHSHRVSDYSVLIARELGLNGDLENDIRIGSLLHDIGKIGIPDHVLLKNGKLTAEEFEIIKKHPSTGVNILSQVQLLEPMLPAIAEHHERLDGSGYPGKLMEKEISLMGRIVAVADVFDAMTSHRPYRPAISVPDVLAYLEENAGILFDPTCVQALGNIIRRSS